MTLLTRYSMVKEYRRCPKAYQYKYVRNLQRIKPAAPLLRGTILHELLDARATTLHVPKKVEDIFNKYNKQFGTLFKEERDIYGETFLADIRRIYYGYDALYANDGWKYEASEELLETKLTEGIRFIGHLDKRVYTKKDGRRWIVDHKTHKVLPTEDQRFHDYQILLYVWAYNRENSEKPVDGIIWDYLRTKAPAIPEQLKNGQLSQRKDMDTDHMTYVRELRRLQLDPFPYETFLTELKKRSERKFYMRVSLPSPSVQMTKSVVSDFIATTRRMFADTHFPRTMTRDCSWCEYYRLCTSELRGLDAKYIEKTEFEQKEIQDETSEED